MKNGQVSSEDLLSLLRSTFGYKTFRDSQEEVIHHVMEGKDALVIMPTGGGKSLCYQIPALAMPGLTIVVSPLIALMEDQVMSLRQYGVRARSLHSGHDQQKRNEIFSLLRNNELSLLYMSPETLLNDRFIDFAERQLKISLFAIDEAHCVSVWGNDFRAEYAGLHRLKENFAQVPILALTATADTATQTDILNKLRLTEAKKFISSFERKNIFISSRPGRQRFSQILQVLPRYKGAAGIIYCLSRKGTESIAQKLRDQGHSATAYHAGMTHEQRQKVQRHFQEDRIHIVCATIAFGMGIDKPNIRFVVHYNMPKTLEGYYQEIGRAGRDGLDSEAILFFSWGDFVLLRGFVEKSDADPEFKEVQLAKLHRMWQFAESASCRNRSILNYFGEYREEDCGRCDNCIDPPVVFDGTVLAQKALSAIIRSKEDLNLESIIALLKGQQRPELLQRSLHRSPTFGVGRDLSFVQWREYIQQMINQGIIQVDFVHGHKLCCTPLSLSALRARSQVALKAYIPPSQRKNLVKETRSQHTTDGLWPLLQSWRQQKADQRNVPAQMIVSDAVLRTFVQKKPLFASYLESIDGLGNAKIKDFGTELIQITRRYVLEKDIPKRIKGLTYLKTLNLYNQGLGPDEISKYRECSKATVCSHLVRLYEQGENIDLVGLVSPADLEVVREAWIGLERTEQLGPLRTALNNQYGYDTLVIALALLRDEAKRNVEG